MKKFSINLLKVGLLLVIGLCMFGMTSQVEAADGYDMGSIEKEVGENVVITTPNFKNNSTAIKQAIWDYWIIDDGRKENKDNTTSSYITATLVKESILVQKDNGGYYQKLKINFNKVGSCKLVIQARPVDEDGTWNYWDKPILNSSALLRYEYKITVKEKETKTETEKKEETTQKVTFTVDYNGGKSVDGNETEKAYYNINTEVPLTSAYAVRDGYKLIGWGTDNKTVKYKNGTKIKLTADTKLYAIWEAEDNKEDDKKDDEKDDKKEVVVKTIKDSKGNEIKKDTKLKFVENSTYDAWTLRNGTKFPVSSNTKLGDIENGDIVQVTEITSVSGSTGTFLKVKVISGSAKGEEGYIYYDNNAQKLFETTTETSKEDDKKDDKKEEQADSNVELPEFNVDTEGIMSIVFEMISKLFTFLVEKVLPTVGPMVESAASTLLPLAEQVIGSILQ